MNLQYNEIVVKELINFFEKNNVSCYFNNQQSIIYIYPSKVQNKSYLDYKNEITQFNIFDPMSSFKYGSTKHSTLIDDIQLGHLLLNHLLNKFNNTEYENLFWTTISKIIPINYIISQNDWKITSKILSTKQLRSNGIPSVQNGNSFFEYLQNYIHHDNFENHLLEFCKNNGSLVKRVESQYYLRKIISKLNNPSKFLKFVKIETTPLFVEKNDFVSFVIDKTQLFHQFAEYCDNKFEPIKNLSNLVEKINNNQVDSLKIDKIFLHQTDSTFKELILLVKFNEKINYNFMEFLLFLIKHSLENKNNINISKIFSYYSLNNKLLPNETKKQKTTKI